MQKRKKQERHLKELEMLTSDNCPKRHPFDFRPGELAEIKQLFSDTKGARKSAASSAKASKMTGSKVPGLPVSELKEHFLKVMKLKVGYS